MENINNNYFDGHYKHIWRSLIPEELTNRETDFMIQHFNLQAGNKVLDLMCGYGRHAIALARKGMQVTAVDNLADYISEIAETARKENLAIKAIRADVMKYNEGDTYRLALCMGNSLNFFDEQNTIALLSTVCGQLEKGGHLLIHTWSLAEIAIKQFVEKTWTNSINGIKQVSDSRYLFDPTRIESETTFISPDGKMETRKAIDYIFSVAEMMTILEKAGFSLDEIYGIPGRKKFALGDPRAYIVATRK